MRNGLLKATACAALLGVSSPALALEKHSRAMDDRDPEWGATTTVTIRYYNTCTGWLWVWNGWANGEALGVCVDKPVFLCLLGATWTLTFTPQPSGYGFTGTISVQDRCDCTGNVLASQPWLPGSGFTPHVWGINVPSTFLINITWAAPAGFTNGSAIASDHPAVGPTGPQSCGTCFPSNRSIHSKYFGVGGAYCPGTALNDGICDVEFAMDIGAKCTDWADEISWGQVKNLYR
ncbi:MAG: hypothetical protein ACT4PE_03420 [Candidatus Eiseniibacteriota bacterium]